MSLLRLLDAALAALVTETDPEDEVAMVALPSASATTTAATVRVVGAEEETAILITVARPCHACPWKLNPIFFFNGTNRSRSLPLFSHQIV